MAFAKPADIIAQLGLHDGMEVADFGAGAGYYAILAADKVTSDGRVYAIDIQQDLLTKARGLDHNNRDWIQYIHGDVEERGGSHLKESSVDAVFVNNILFQAGNKAGVFEEAFRILRKRGKMLVVDWTDSFGGLGPPQELVVMATKARELAEAAGFTYERDIEAGDHHWGTIFSK